MAKTENSIVKRNYVCKLESRILKEHSTKQKTVRNLNRVPKDREAYKRNTNTG